MGGHPTGWLTSLGLFLAVVIAAATALLVVDLHDRSVDQTQRSLISLATILGDQADRALQSIELVQQGIIDELRAADVADEAEYIERVSTRAMQETLEARVAALPQVNAITLIDARGKLLNFSRYWPIPDVSIADRDYFQALASNPEVQRFVSRPVQNRGDGNWTLYIARKLTAADGRFMGLVLGAVELSYFERLYAQIAPAPDYVLSMFRTDGMLLVRQPSIPQAVGLQFQTAGAQLVTQKGAPRGTIRNVSPIDGQDRLNASEILPHFPIRFSVSRMTKASLKPWREQATILGVAAALFVACLISLALLGLRQAFQRERLSQAEAARSRAEERAQGELALREEYIRFGVALDNMTQGLCMFDAAGRILVANHQLANVLGLPGPLLVGTGLVALLKQFRVSRPLRLIDAVEAVQRLRPLMTLREQSHFTWLLADDRTVFMHLQPMKSGGWLLTCEDVTARRQAEARVTFLAHHDALTSLPNRTLFGERLEQAMVLALRGIPCTVLCVDLDGFKDVNDTHGHAAGDLLLRDVAMRLQRCARETDTVARLGGDEFAVILASVGEAEAAGQFAGRVIEELALPYDLDGQTVAVAASVGIAIVPTDGKEAEEVLRHADVALYSAKEAGTGEYRFFEAEMNRALQERRQMEGELRVALARGEFELHYQPLVRVTSRKIVGFEALLRWRHPVRGLIPPCDFIPRCEENGLIVPIGEWVLRTACAEATSWPGRLTVAVNLSPLQMRHHGLIGAVSDALGQTGLSSAQLELEITETVLLQDTAETLDTLRRLHDLGVSIALDDFGTGYSSLSYLRSFPFDKVKIDRCFVRDLGTDREARAIVRAITGLCAELGISTLAEGVEQEEHLEVLAAEQCRDVQGFLFSPPCTAFEVPILLEHFAKAIRERPGARPSQPDAPSARR